MKHFICPICSSPLRFMGKRKELNSTVEGELYRCGGCRTWWIKWQDEKEKGLKRLFIPPGVSIRARQ